MGEFEVGQEVRVFDVNRRRNSSPNGVPCRVYKVGRTMLHVVTEERWNDPTPPRAWEVWKFRLDSRQTADNYGHQSVYTLDEVAEQRFRSERAAVLRKAGVEFRLGYRPSTELLDALACAVESVNRG